jgi:hypothetical protein
MFGTSLDCASCSDSISIKSYMIWNSFLRLCSVNIVELGHRANQLLIPTSSSLCRIFVHGVLTREGRIYWNFISVVYFTLRRYFFSWNLSYALQVKKVIEGGASSEEKRWREGGAGETGSVGADSSTSASTGGGTERPAVTTTGELDEMAG